MASNLSDKRDNEREIGPSICLNISSDTVHYQVIYFPKYSLHGVKQDGCDRLGQKVFRKGIL